MGDFNPAFAFDIEDRSKPAQTPWDFAGTSLGSSVCFKHAKSTCADMVAYHGPPRAY